MMNIQHKFGHLLHNELIFSRCLLSSFDVKNIIMIINIYITHIPTSTFNNSSLTADIWLFFIFNKYTKRIYKKVSELSLSI